MNPTINNVTPNRPTTVVDGGPAEVTITLEAPQSVLVRDHIPVGWTVAGGDPFEVDIGRSVTFAESVHDGTRRYEIRPPAHVEEPRSYRFGPVSCSHDGVHWRSIPGTSATITVDPTD